MARADIVLAAALALAAVGATETTATTAPPAALTTATTPSVRAQRAAVLAVARAGDRIVTAGERGTVLLSDDGGIHWRQAKVPVRATLTALQFIDDHQGWAVGHFGVVLHTEDGGETWSLQLDGIRAAALAESVAQTPKAVAASRQLVEDGPDKPLLALHFSDAQHGLVVGAYNLALRTDDGGRNWRYVGHDLPNPRQLHLYGIAVHGQQWLMAGEQGLLMASDDGGQQFSAVTTPYPGSYFGAMAAQGGAVLAYGLRGSAYRSDDAGQSWQKADVPTAQSLSAGLTLADGRLLLASQGGELLVSADQGRRFERLNTPPVPVAALVQNRDGGLVLGTLRGPLVVPLPH